MQQFSPRSQEAIIYLKEQGLTETPSGDFTEFYIGKSDKANLDEMDRRAAELTAHIPGIRVGQRAKIGKNMTCPCGSGLKFKKCCIDKARPA